MSDLKDPLPWPKEPDEVEENTFEGHRNQAKTDGARRRERGGGAGAVRKKVVALQLEPDAYARLQEMGGAEALRKMLGDAALCARVGALLKGRGENDVLDC